MIVCVAYDFGVIGGCKESREVIIKGWRSPNVQVEEYNRESKVYTVLSISPMKGCPSLIGSPIDPKLFAFVFEKLGPSLKDLCNLMSPNARFDEKMTLALAIQMVR